MKTPRRIFDVKINGRIYSVYDIGGKEHEGLNDSPKTWWIYYTNELPKDLNLIPPANSPDFYPYCRYINRRLWDIRFKQTNSSKSKYGGLSFSQNTSVEMWCNDRLVYAFSTNDMSFAFAKVQYFQVVLTEHVYDFFEPENNEGRKICWYGLPATIRVKGNTWEVAIIPDYTEGLDKESWWKEYTRRKSKLVAETENSKEEREDEEMDDREDYQNDYINWGDALSDGNISWFRN